jgi:hypothetical protein
VHSPPLVVGETIYDVKIGLMVLVRRSAQEVTGTEDATSVHFRLKLKLRLETVLQKLHLIFIINIIVIAGSLLHKTVKNVRSHNLFSFKWLYSFLSYFHQHHIFSN